MRVSACRLYGHGVDDGPVQQSTVNHARELSGMVTLCGQHVVLKVQSVELMQMGNVLDFYLLNFVVLPTENQTHKPG